MSKRRGRSRGPLGSLFRYGLLGTIILLILLAFFYKEVIGCLGVLIAFMFISWIYHMDPMKKI